jgi:hypothetical protein
MVVRPAAALYDGRASLRFGTFVGVPKRRLFIFVLPFCHSVLSFRFVIPFCHSVGTFSFSETGSAAEAV